VPPSTSCFPFRAHAASLTRAYHSTCMRVDTDVLVQHATLLLHMVVGALCRRNPGQLALWHLRADTALRLSRFDEAARCLLVELSPLIGDPTASEEDELPVPTLRKLVSALQGSGDFLEAAILCQFFDDAQLMGVLCQAAWTVTPASTVLFEYVFDMTLFETLVQRCSQQDNRFGVEVLLELISQARRNQFNAQPIQRRVLGTLRRDFLQHLVRTRLWPLAQ